MVRIQWLADTRGFSYFWWRLTAEAGRGTRVWWRRRPTGRCVIFSFFPKTQPVSKYQPFFFFCEQKYQPFETKELQKHEYKKNKQMKKQHLNSKKVTL
jgi:hypothetical protein